MNLTIRGIQEGKTSNYRSILEVMEAIHVQVSGLAVASCLAVNKRDGKPLCSTLEGRPKWGASAPLLMRSPPMESWKQLHSSSFLGICVSTTTVDCYALQNKAHDVEEYISFKQGCPR